MSVRRLAIIGDGRMGQALASLAPEREWKVAVVIGSDTNRDGRAITRETLAGVDVAVEFTEPGAAPANVLACARAGCPVVTGTTGWYDRLDEIARGVIEAGGAMLWAANYSIGVNVFAAVVWYAARLVGRAQTFDAQIVETHHSAKQDAPSGTAEMLARLVADAMGRPVPIASVRTGSVPGTHELLFDAPFEQIRLEHIARDRRVFAEGALIGARWLIGRRGVYTMRDVLEPAEETP